MLLSHFVPCRQDVSSVRFFACTISVRAYQTAPPCQICKTFDAPVLCAATADVLRTGLHVQVSRVRRRRNQASACFCRAFATQRVRSKVESLRALHQYTNVQRRSALHTTPATLVARPAPVESLHSWSHCGRFVVHERRNQFASAYAALRLQLGLRRSSCCACLHANAMEDARKPSQRLGQRLYDALRRSKLKFAGRRFHEQSLRADDTNRSMASSDAAELGGSQAALHRP
jgi:hypothetical protein